ncbi:MAG: HlyD family efflux transporter periplasmic adaptor subunit [Opitutaceae bacterium]|nr:HlyD family efflux transporter periplasmic adaptor subunit [Opitutaceae bacterium]
MKNVPPPDRWPRWTVAALLAAACTLGACTRHGGTAADLVLSGNIEVTDAQLGFKIPGRVAERLVAEGDRVQAGQLIARLDDAEQKEQLALRQAELDGAQAALAALEAGSRPQEIAAAGAALHSAEADRDRARLDFARQTELRGKDAIADRDLETSQAQLKVAEARTTEAAERLKLVQEGPRAEDIAQGRARVEQARASAALAGTQLENTRLLSPLTGVVLSHNIEPGEFVSAGTPVVTVADTAHVWVRAYVNQTDLGRIRLGQKVAVHTDTFPDKTYAGTVGFIASEAEFTPKTVQTTKERVKLVFRVKIDIANPNDELKPGMPADAIIPANP